MPLLSLSCAFASNWPAGHGSNTADGMQALHQQKSSRTTATAEGEDLSGEVSFRQGQTVSIPAETSGRGQIGHAADVAALSEFSHSPLRPPVAVQRSPVRGHRRQLSTVAEEAYTPASDAAKRALPMLNLKPLTQQQEQYNGPQELYQSTVYTSEATEVRTSATASNFSDAAAQNGGQALQASRLFHGRQPCNNQRAATHQLHSASSGGRKAGQDVPARAEQTVQPRQARLLS